MRKLFTLVALSVLIACGGSDGMTAPVTVVGVWSLSTVNGVPLPFIAEQSGTSKSEVTGGSLTMASSTYSVTFSSRNTTNGVVTTPPPEVDNGTFTTNGTAITLHSSVSATTLTGSFGANSMTLTEPGYAYVFTR